MNHFLTRRAACITRLSEVQQGQTIYVICLTFQPLDYALLLWQHWPRSIGVRFAFVFTCECVRVYACVSKRHRSKPFPSLVLQRWWNSIPFLTICLFEWINVSSSNNAWHKQRTALIEADFMSCYKQKKVVRKKRKKKIKTSLCKFKLVAGDIMLIRLLVA